MRLPWRLFLLCSSLCIHFYSKKGIVSSLSSMKYRKRLRTLYFVWRYKQKCYIKITKTSCKIILLVAWLLCFEKNRMQQHTFNPVFSFSSKCLNPHCSNMLALQMMGPRARSNALQASGICSESIVWMDPHRPAPPPPPPPQSQKCSQAKTCFLASGRCCRWK